jgi:hypothetical protein
MIINETAGILPTAARNERPQFFARMALVMAVLRKYWIRDELTSLRHPCRAVA